MPVTVDDKPLAAETLGLQTVGQLLAHLQQKEKRLVVHVLIDGQEPDPARLGELRAAALTDHTLFIETAEPRRMALEVLGTIEQHLQETDKLRTDCVSLLRGNHTLKAMEKLRGCFSAWQHAQESVVKTAQLLRIDLSRIVVDGRPFSDVLREFTEQLKLIKNALENRDFVSLIDTLVYETAETSDNWRGHPLDEVGRRRVTRVTIRDMALDRADLQSLCDRGQEQLMRMEYLAAEATLVSAERIALELGDYDTLSRLYMPLQEARRQRRQRCGEGIVRLDLIAAGQNDKSIDPPHIVERYPHGQLLIAGWQDVRPAMEVRRWQAQRGLYMETFLAAVYPLSEGRAIVLVPLADVALPRIARAAESIDELSASLPAHCVVLPQRELPPGEHPGTPQTYARVMALWERLHAPFLAAADREQDPVLKIQAYQRTIEVDYACELAHQRLSAVAHELARKRR